MLSQISHAVILILIITLSFQAKPFYQHELLFVPTVLMVYWLIKMILAPHPLKHRLFDAVVFTLLLTNLVNATGGVSSALFFLNYCLIFGLSLLLEPFVSFTTAAALMAFYLWQLPTSQTFKDLLPVISIALISPFGFFLGQEYQKILEQKKDILILKKKNETLIKAIDRLLKEHEKQS